MPLKNDDLVDCPATERMGQEVRSPSASESVAMTNDYQKFSDFLTSPVFSVVVGNETSKTFLLHAALLDHESDELAKDINSGFREGETRRIVLNQEDPGLFGYFVDYLYSDRWLGNGDASRDADYIILARLYTLGERLQAKNFQRAALRKFTSSLTKGTTIADQSVCELLEIACTELPERVNEDPLRSQIFWYAASRLTMLQDYDYFLQLLDVHKDLGTYLCVRAGSSTASQPKKPSESLPLRFKPESIF